VKAVMTLREKMREKIQKKTASWADRYRFVIF
jgi:hypothetical protein